MSLSLYTISSQYQQAFMALADSDLPEDCINDTIEGMDGELIDKGRAVAAFWLNLGAEIEAMKIVEKRIYDRRKAIEARQERLKEYLSRNMAACGISEIKSSDGTFTAKLYIGRDESVVIDDVSAIPSDYMTEKVIIEPSKTLISAAIKDGYEVAGAHIQKKDRLTIK